MGSKSSSSSASTNQAIDNRIAATDSAIVLTGGSSLSLTDPGLVDLAEGALSQNEKILMEVLSGARDFGLGALDKISSQSDKAFEFVNERSTSEDETTFRKAVPWLMAGASVFAIAWAVRGK